MRISRSTTSSGSGVERKYGLYEGFHGSVRAFEGVSVFARAWLLSRVVSKGGEML
jgi:hypothetical protein